MARSKKSSQDEPQKTHTIYGKKITLYKRETGKTPYSEKPYQYRFLNPFGEGYIRRSTGTDSFKLASKIAIDHYTKCQVQVELGLTDTGITIDTLWERFNGRLGRKPATKKAWLNIWKRVRPYWIKKGDLGNISDDEIISYVDEIDRTWVKTPNRREQGFSALTIKQDLALLKFLFTRAMNDRLTVRVPHFPTMRELERRNYRNIFFQETKHLRVIWNEEQQRAISTWQTNFRKRWKARLKWERSLGENYKGEQRTSKDWGLPDPSLHMGNGGKRFSDIRAYFWITLIKQSLARPQEVKLLQMKDITLLIDREYRHEGRIETTVFTIIKIDRHKAKTNKTREVVCFNLGAVWEIFEDWKYEWERHYGRPPLPDDLIFPMTLDSTKVQTAMAGLFRNTLRQLDKELGIVVSEGKDFDGYTKGITLYSIRKMAITNVLKKSLLPPHLVCKMAATSEAMLEKHYNVNLNREYRYIFTKAVRDAERRKGSDRFESKMEGIADRYEAE